MSLNGDLVALSARALCLSDSIVLPVLPDTSGIPTASPYKVHMSAILHDQNLFIQLISPYQVSSLVFSCPYGSTLAPLARCTLFFQNVHELTMLAIPRMVIAIAKPPTTNKV